MLWLFAVARATEYAGIPVHGVAGVGEPHFFDPMEGWGATVQGGRIWVFVGADEAEAAAWLDRQGQHPAVAMRGVDDARGRQGTVLFRRGNVAARVQAAAARQVAVRLRDSIVEVAPRPIASTWERRPCPDVLGVEAPGAAAIQEVGGRISYGDGAIFGPFPRAPVFVWDQWGRAREVWSPTAQ